MDSATIRRCHALHWRTQGLSPFLAGVKHAEGFDQNDASRMSTCTVSPGLDARHDLNCRMVGLRMPTLYSCCQRCDRIPVAVVGAQQLADRQRQG